MKIALIGRFGEGEILSGPERVARELFYELKNKNYQVTFIEYFFSDYQESSLFKKLFGKKNLENKTILRLGIFPILITLIKNRFDIIHIVNSQRFQFFLLFFFQFFHRKIVATLHGLLQNEFEQMNKLPKRYFIDKWVEQLIIRNSSMLIFPSNLLQRIFNEYYQLSGKNYQIIPNGVSKNFENKNYLPKKFGRQLRIVFYNGPDSSFSRGLQKLINLLEKVQVEINLFVLGAEENIKVDDQNIKISFFKLFTHDDLIQFLVNKQFVIKSNLFDSFPGFVTECMCIGLIPIINDNIGIIDFIEDRKNGFVYKKDSNEDLQQLIEDISKGNYDLEMISNNAMKIFEKINWSNIANKYIDAYKSVL